MAAPVYDEDLTDIHLAEIDTSWVAIGGGNIAIGYGPDFSMQGTNCVDGKVSNSDKGPGVAVGSFTPGANTHIFAWLFLATPGLSANIVDRGLCVVLGTDVTNYVKFHVEGKDTYGAAGRVGKCYAIRYINTNKATPPNYRTILNAPSATAITFIGGTTNSALVKSSNIGVDAFRYGTGAYLTAGELISAGDGSDNPCTFAGFQATNDTATNRWGILTLVAGAYELKGRFVIGQDNTGTATLCRFRDSNKTINFADTVHALSDFTQIIIDHASSRCEWTNINLNALGTTNPGRLVVNSANPTTIINGGVYSNIGITTLRSNSTLTGVTWINCGVITMNGGAVPGGLISGYEGTADTASMVWNSSTDPNTKLLNTKFVKGTAATHAIEFSDGTLTEINLPGCTFTNYNASNGQNDSALYFTGTARTVTVYCAANPSYKATAGINVTVVTSSRTVKIAVVDVDGAAVTGTNVFLRTNGAGSLPYNVTVGGIVNAGTTATVTHNGHGMVTNDKVLIRGASLDANNGVFTIDVSDVDTYTYTMGSAPGSSPTGTIKCWFVFLWGLANQGTDSNERSMSRSIPGTQLVLGWARKGSGTPFYKTGGVSGSVTSGADLPLTAVMTLDE